MRNIDLSVVSVTLLLLMMMIFGTISLPTANLWFQSQTRNQRVHRIRMFPIECAIRKNQSENGTWYNVAAKLQGRSRYERRRRRTWQPVHCQQKRICVARGVTGRARSRVALRLAREPLQLRLAQRSFRFCRPSTLNPECQPACYSPSPLLLASALHVLPCSVSYRIQPENTFFLLSDQSVSPGLLGTEPLAR